LALPLAAQMRESIDVRVLELEAAVLDRAGHPVEGLKQEDFRVQVGKEEVPITNFYAVRNGVVLAEENAPRSAKSVSAETSIPTSLVIFIDELHLSPGSRRRALNALQRYVKANVGANTTAMLVRYYNHFDVVMRPTERPGLVLAEIEKLAKSPFLDDSARERERMIGLIDGVLAHNFGNPVDFHGDSPETVFGRIVDYAERQMSDVERTLTALESAIQISSSFSGRKVLLYVSDGLPQMPAAELFDYWDRLQTHAVVRYGREGTIRLDSREAMRVDCSSKFTRVAETAQRANVAIYSFDAAGLRGLEGRGMESTTMSERINSTLMYSNLRQGLQHVADETGGMYIANDNDIDRVLARMSEQFSSYYSIGVRPRGGEIKVTVNKRPDLRVLAVKRVPPRSREERIEQNLRTRLYTRTAENPLAISADLGTPATLRGNCVVPIIVRMQPVTLPVELTPPAFDMYLVMLNEQNEESAVQRISIPFEQQQLRHQMMLRVRPEKHVLSIAVTNPKSGETSFLQREVDGTMCH
jgi:VWFA-related protein